MRYIITLCTFTLVGMYSGCNTYQHPSSKLPYYLDAALTPIWPGEPGMGQEDLHKVPSFRFTNQEGEILRSEDIEGKIYVANFFFVNCTKICPSMRSNLMEVQAAFQEDDAVRILSHTVMPELDTVTALHAYASVNQIVPGKWDLLTGSKEGIYKHAQMAYFADIEDDIADSFLHTETFFLVDHNRHIRGVYNGTLEFDVNRLIQDIQLLKQEITL